jgi:hypothetical protein
MSTRLYNIEWTDGCVQRVLPFCNDDILDSPDGFIIVAVAETDCGQSCIFDLDFSVNGMGHFAVRLEHTDVFAAMQRAMPMFRSVAR